MAIKLYYTPHTRSLRPRWTLEELGLAYELAPIDLFGGEGDTPAYRRIHPHGSVPAMEIDGRVMIESCAMCHWLGESHPTAQLVPPAQEAQARRNYLQWSFYVPGTLEPPAFQILLHTAILPPAQRVPDIVPWADEYHQVALRTVDACLRERDHIAGEQFTVADILLGSTLLWLPDRLEDFPALGAYTRRLQQRPAYQRAVTDPSPPA